MGLRQTRQDVVLGPADRFRVLRGVAAVRDLQHDEHTRATRADERAHLRIDHEVGSRYSGAWDREAHDLGDDKRGDRPPHSTHYCRPNGWRSHVSTTTGPPGNRFAAQSRASTSILTRPRRTGQGLDAVWLGRGCGGPAAPQYAGKYATNIALSNRNLIPARFGIGGRKRVGGCYSGNSIFAIVPLDLHLERFRREILGRDMPLCLHNEGAMAAANAMSPEPAGFDRGVKRFPSRAA